jgi:hypothetical protein
MTVEVFEPHPSSLHQRMLMREGQEQLLFEQPLGVQMRLGDRQGKDADV